MQAAGGSGSKSARLREGALARDAAESEGVVFFYPGKGTEVLPDGTFELAFIGNWFTNSEFISL